MAWKKETTQTIEIYSVVEKNLTERLKLGNAYICELHYKNDDMMSSLQVSYKINFNIFVMLIASAKIQDHEGSISSSSCYGLLPGY